ncbi:MAG: hypothetical protein IPG39_19340 [Bacteroidetes bacterium]|nr:hypothetical protein [Bacteroidota bacterium]
MISILTLVITLFSLVGVINGFVTSYDVNATLQWAFGIGQPTGGSQILATTTDNDGNVFITGWFAGTLGLGQSLMRILSAHQHPSPLASLPNIMTTGAFQNIISLRIFQPCLPV